MREGGRYEVGEDGEPRLVERTAPAPAPWQKPARQAAPARKTSERREPRRKS